MFYSLVCCCLVTKSCLTLCDPMDCSTSGCSLVDHCLIHGQLGCFQSFVITSMALLTVRLMLLVQIGLLG